VRLLLAGILVVAAALRLTTLGSVPGFDGDEGIGLFYARQVAEHAHFELHPLRPYLGPYKLWLAVPFLEVFGFTPFAARLFPAGLGVVAVWLAWRIGRRWGDPSGLAAAALLAAGPTFAGYARVSLAVAHMPAIAVIAWALLLRASERRTALSAAGFGAVIGAGVAFHPTGLLLGMAAGLALALHPGGRQLLRRPLLVGAAALGFAATGWVSWELILAQVGLGPGVDLSMTHVDEAVARGLHLRLWDVGAVGLDTAAGGRSLEWLSGVPSSEQWLLWPLRLAAALGLVLASVRVARERDPVAMGLLAAVVLTAGLTAVKAARFDLQVVGRERYLLVPVTLLFLLLPYGLLGLGGEATGRRLRAGVALVAAWCLLSLGGLYVGLFGPMWTTGSHNPSPSMIAAWPDAKLQTARWMLDRMQPGEEGLFLAGDGWSYWSVLCFLGERMPADFVPEEPAECSAILERTRHRRRFLVDFVGGQWLDEIGACLEGAGYGGRAPAFAPTTPDGRPILYLWELEPDGPAGP